MVDGIEAQEHGSPCGSYEGSLVGLRSRETPVLAAVPGTRPLRTAGALAGDVVQLLGALHDNLRALYDKIDSLTNANRSLQDQLARSQIAVGRLVRKLYLGKDVAPQLAANASLQRENEELRAQISELLVDIDAYRARDNVRRSGKRGLKQGQSTFSSRAERRKFEALFDHAFYLKTYPDVAKAGMDPVHHYLEYGFSEGRFPHPLFDTRYYLATYEDVRRSGVNPFLQFLRQGESEGRKPNAWLDVSWYAVNNPDIAQSGLGPFAHYAKIGAFEARDPGPIFQARTYFSKHPQVRKGEVDPLAHWLHTKSRNLAFPG